MAKANMKINEILELIDEISDNQETPMVKMDGYDDCIAGVVIQFGAPQIVCYDYEKVIKSLIKQGMNREDAIEFFEFNQLGASVGDTTPCFIRRF